MKTLKFCLILLIALGLCALAPMLFPAAAQQHPASEIYPYPGPDTDEDRINDDWEELVIPVFAPEYRYDILEAYWPSSLTWHVQRSRLRKGNERDCTGPTLFGQDQLGPNPLLVLTATRDGDYSDVRLDDRGLHDYYLDLDDDDRYGETAAGSNREHLRPETGIFAHVLPVYGQVEVNGDAPDVPVPTSTDGRPSAILIQYWQFFSYNQADPTGFDVGNHEGDWLFLEVYLIPFGDLRAPNRDWIQWTVHHHHGDGTCPPSVRARNPSGDIHDSLALTSDTHPIAYLEQDGHEWWPFSSLGSCGGRTHIGNGLRYIPYNIINVGSRYAPMSRTNDTSFVRNERTLFLFFNGRWGTGNCENTFSHGAAPPWSQYFFVHERPWSVVYVDTLINNRGVAYGSRYYPYNDVEEAIEIDSNKTHVRDGGLIRFGNGEFRGDGIGSLRFDRPMTLQKSPHVGPGTAVIRP